MNRIRIRFIRCIGASVATLACVGLFPLSAAATDVDAEAATPAAAQSGPQSGAQSGASTPTAPATPEAPPASPEATPDRTAAATPEATPASSDDAPPTPDPAQPEPGDPAEPAPDNPAEPEPPAPVTSQWVRHAEGWRYESSDGTWLKDGVFDVGGVRYAFNADGFVPRGWYRAPDGVWYASTENGVRTGWYRDGAAWYLLTDSGAMTTGWQVSDGAWYYLDPDRGGMMATGWTTIAGTWYHFGSSGAMSEAAWVWAGAWYYLGDSGAMATGWFQAGGSWYYADSSGAMATGWLRDGSWYYLRSSGAMATGWLQEGANWYYLDPNSGGAMATSWAMVDGSWNYFDRWSGFWVSGRASFEADWNYAKTLYSPTNYLIVVDTNAPHCMTFYWAAGSWQPLTDMPCSVGKPSTPTVTGTFSIKNRGHSFGHGYTAYWWTQFHGDYLFHSILYHEGTMSVLDGTLGGHVSHGCVRLRYSDAKWLHDTIPSGTYVTIY